MPPKTYKHKPGSMVIGPGVMRERPHLAAMLADCIATGAEIEAALGNTLAALLGANAKPALAMYAALTGPGPQSAALTAAAAAVLEPKDLDLFEAVRSVLNTALKDRHRFAHFCWAYSPETHEHLLAIDPEAWRALYQWVDQVAKRKLGSTFPASDILGFDRNMVLVYTQKDFEESLDRLETARLLVLRLLAYFTETSEKADKRYRQLSSEPQVKEALDRIHERRKSNP